MKYIRNYVGKKARSQVCNVNFMACTCIHHGGCMVTCMMLLQSCESSTTPSKGKGKMKAFPRAPLELSQPALHEMSEATAERHRKFPQAEQKLNPNAGIIKQLMEKSFSSRRKYIIETAARIPDILKLWPSLRRCDQV